MKRFAIAIAVIVCTLTTRAQIDINSKSYVQFLFPETAEFTFASDMNRCNSAGRSDLIKAIPGNIIGLDSTIERDAEYRELLQTMLRNADDILIPNYLYYYDYTKDGKPDIIYIGPNPLTEEDSMTLFWINTGNGYRFDIDRSCQKYLLAIENNSKPRFCWRYDAQFAEELVAIGIQSEFGSERKYVAHVRQEFPKKPMSPVKFVSVVPDMKLRLTTAEADTYLPNESRYSPMAIFGNITSKFMAGVKGVVRGKSVDEKGQTWYFIIFDEKNGKYRTYSPYEVHMGWVRDYEIKLPAN